MRGKKRGLLLLVLVIALLILSLSIIAETLPVNNEAYVAIGGRYDEGGSEDSCDNSDVSIKNLAPKGQKPDWHGDNWWDKCNGYSDCRIPPAEGCWFLVIDPDNDENDNGWLWSHFGEYFYHGEHQDPKEGNEYDSGYDGDANDAHDCVLNYNFNYHNGLVCAGDGYWHECNAEEGTLGTITWVENIIYNCTLDEFDQPIWEKTSVDLDRDGHLSDVDCNEDVSNDPPGCPELDKKTGEINCLYPAHSKCAICINPGAPEVCGDFYDDGSEIDNDCNPLTSNDCNNFKEGCNQDSRSNPAEGERTDIHHNIYGQNFPWVKTGANEGFCCGYNGIDDLGKTVTGISDDAGGDYGEFVCLSTNEDLTAHQGGIPWEGSGDYCKENWCLANAQGLPTTGGKFNIYTINKPGEKPYDIVSNANAWFECNESVTFLPEPEAGFIIPGEEQLFSGTLISYSNRFQCYKEGDHYSWAECIGEEDKPYNNGVKGRFQGEGLFTLPLSPVGENTLADEVISHLGFLDIFSSAYYSDFYGEDHLLDFSGYDTFNFMVQYCSGDCEDGDFLTLKELKDEGLLPLNINLTMSSKDRQILFTKNVLGDITNNLAFGEDIWTHVKVDIPNNMKGVYKTRLASGEDEINFRIRNIYLGKNEQDETPLCSGKDAANEKPWLTDIDDGTPSVNGEDLCKALYGDTAWLGKDSKIDNTYREYANCCGDDPNEYYAGPSLGEEGEQFGCWNSQAIKDKNTSMNIEFKVSYKEEEYNFEDIGYVFNGGTLSSSYASFSSDEIRSQLDWTWVPDWLNSASESRIYASQNNADKFCTKYGFNSAKSFTEEPCNSEEEIANYIYGASINDNNLGDGWYSFYCGDSWVGTVFGSILTSVECKNNNNNNNNNGLVIPTSNLNVTNKQKIVHSFVPKNLLSDVEIGRTTFNFTYTPSDSFEINFYNSQTWETVGTEIESGQLMLTKEEIKELWHSKISLVVELKPEVQLLTSTNIPSYNKNKTFSFACSQQECLYPLPGITEDRTIENLHPELYDLYFVYLDETNSKPIYDLIEGVYPADKPGNVIAKRVSQQVVFIADEEDSKFYGCQAADYIKDGVPEKFFQDQPYCSIKGEQFCSPSVRKKALVGQDQYTLVNSWSDEQITEVGYLPDTSEEQPDFETYFDQLVLKLDDSKTIEPENRSYTTSVVPFKNIIPNAEFISGGSQIPHWELLGGITVEDSEKNQFNKTQISLSEGQRLRSEKIAVNKTATYYFSNNGSIEIKIYVDDKENTFTIDNGETFEPNSDFIIIEFSDGTVFQPFLQLVDDLGIGEYNYELQEYPDKFNFRSGLACCPENNCWNGYTCVEPMEDVAKMTEHFGLGRDYRCIAGQWTHLPVKWDWNNQKWGFCSEEEQCFVTSVSQATSNNTAEDFYKGNAPICINPSESILDHYCQDGNWTSRTKFLASKLVEVAGNDEFILYCTNYKKALIDYGLETYLGGELPKTVENTPDLGDLNIEQPEEQTYTCFEDINKISGGKDLVPQKENTCINNMCVLRYKEGSKFKTAFATTLNKNLTDPSSYLLAFGVAQEELNTICQGEDGFVKCDFDGNKMWYSQELNAIVYDKDGISLTPGPVMEVIQDFTDWFKDLFGIGTDLPEFENFVVEATNFNELYLLNKEGKKAKVVRELAVNADQPQESILSEYEGFTTPICEYVNNLALPGELQTELLLTVSNYSKYNCTEEEGKQKLQIIINKDDNEDDDEGLNYFWEKLTGKLRVGSFN
jgi:hypothetical protein